MNQQLGQVYANGWCPPYGYSMLEPAQIKQEPVNVKQEPLPDSTSGNSPKKKAGRPKKLKQEKITDHVTVKKKRKIDRFKGMPEEEVVLRLLPDHLAPNLDIVIVGINPGLYAAFVGHHYAGPGNHFWKCLYLSGLIPEPMNAMQDFKLLEHGIGFTNIVARTTKGSADLSRKEIKEGATILTEKLLKYRPKIAVFNGKGIYEVFVGHKNFHFGKQPEKLPGTETAVFVMPSSSARCSQLPRAVDKVPFYEALKKFRDHLNGKHPDLDESEITFPDVFLKTAVKKEIKEEVKEENSEQYPGEMNPGERNNVGQFPGEMNPGGQFSGQQQLSQFVPGSYQVIPHTSQSSTSSQGSFNQSSLDYRSTSQSPHVVPGTGSPAGTGPVQVKQEPVDVDCHNTNSQSETISIGQFEVYNQSQSSSQPDPHLNNFLNGLYGLVGQVAGEDRNTSKYGIVSNTGMFANRPVQFNDALRDIVKETDDLETNACMDSVQQHDVPQEPQGKTTKAGRPRKRKSKTAEETPPMPLATSTSPSQLVTSPNQQISSPNQQVTSLNQQISSPNQLVTSPNQQVTSPNQHYSHPMSSHSPNNQSPMLHTMQPYTSHMSAQSMTAPGYSSPYMSHMQPGYHPAMFGYPPNPQSYTQMMSNGSQAMEMMHNTHMMGYPPQHPYTTTPNANPVNGFNPNMPIKQEKPDN